MARTTCVIAAGRLSAKAPLFGVMSSARAEVRDTTTGVPQVSDFNVASPNIPNISCGPRANVTSAEANSLVTVCWLEMKPMKSISGQAV